MRITKTYCDICKEEIPENSGVISKIALGGYMSMTSGTCGNVNLEVCRECGVEFFTLLEKRKKSAECISELLKVLK